MILLNQLLQIEPVIFGRVHIKAFQNIIGHSFTNYTEKDGLIHGDIYCMLEDGSGNIWIGTSWWSCVFNGLSFIHLHSKEGLLNDEIFSLLADREWQYVDWYT
jgi:hypothetical protein